MSIAAKLRAILRRRPSGAERSPAADAPRIEFRCNICGSPCAAAMAALLREAPSCRACGSTVRTRTIVHLLATELFGESLALPDFPVRRDIIGIGLSDSEGYASRLAAKLNYRNTFFHAEPKLDITEESSEQAGRYDFIIASDVFEHVEPPVSRAFANARRLLKPGGVFVFSVPFSLDPDTVEHFPELHEYRLLENGGRWRLENRTADGRAQTFTELVFHGGPGSTLEMRLFSRAALEREFAAAGFVRTRFANEAYLPYGIVWPEPWSVPVITRAPPADPGHSASRAQAAG